MTVNDLIGALEVVSKQLESANKTHKKQVCSVMQFLKTYDLPNIEIGNLGLSLGAKRTPKKAKTQPKDPSKINDLVKLIIKPFDNDDVAGLKEILSQRQITEEVVREFCRRKNYSFLKTKKATNLSIISAVQDSLKRRDRK